MRWGRAQRERRRVSAWEKAGGRGQVGVGARRLSERHRRRGRWRAGRGDGNISCYWRRHTGRRCPRGSHSNRDDPPQQRLAAWLIWFLHRWCTRCCVVRRCGGSYTPPLTTPPFPWCCTDMQKPERRASPRVQLCALACAAPHGRRPALSSTASWRGEVGARRERGSGPSVALTCASR